MDICQQYFYYLMMYSYIGAYITCLRHDHKEWIVSVSAETLPHDGFVIKHDSILLPIIQKLHSFHSLFLVNDDSSDTEAGSKNVLVNPEPKISSERYWWYATLG